MVLYRSGDSCHHQPVDADERKERGMRDADRLHETSDPWRLMMSDPDMKNAEHIEQQPVPGHTENIPSDGSDERRDGESGTQRLEDVAPGADPDTKPGTPPGTQSDADRTRSPD